MDISFVGAALTNPAGANTTVTPNLPAGILTGDLMILSVTENKAPIVITDPTGWTVLDGPTAETAATQKIYYRVATVDGGTAPTISSDTTGQWRADVAAYRGVDPAAPFLAHGARIEPGNGTTVVHSAPTLTNTDPGAWGVFAAAFRQVSTPASWTPGAGLTERLDADTAQSTSANLTQCFDDTAGPIAVGDWTFSASSSSGSAQAVMWAGLLKPAAGAGPQTVTGAGLASGEAFGVGAVAPGAVTVTGAGLASAAAFGVGSASLGSITVNGAGLPSALAFGAGSVALSQHIGHMYVTAVLASDGTSVATLATTNGFGTAFGLGTQPLGTSPLGGQSATVPLLPADAALASDGISEADLLAELPLTAILHTTD